MQKVNLSQPIWKKVLFVILATVAVVCAVTAAVLPLSKGDLANADSSAEDVVVLDYNGTNAVAYFYSDHTFKKMAYTEEDRVPKIADGNEYRLIYLGNSVNVLQDPYGDFRPCTATHEQWEANWREYPAASTQYSSYFKEGVTHDFRSDSTHRAIPYDDVYHISKCRMCDQTMLIAHNLNENGVCEDCGWQKAVSRIYFGGKGFAIFYGTIPTSSSGTVDNFEMYKDGLPLNMMGLMKRQSIIYSMNDTSEETYDLIDQLGILGDTLADNGDYNTDHGAISFDTYRMYGSSDWLDEETSYYEPVWNTFHDFRVWNSEQIYSRYTDSDGHVVICQGCGLAIKVPHRYGKDGKCIDCNSGFEAHNDYRAIACGNSIFGVFDTWDEIIDEDGPGGYVVPKLYISSYRTLEKAEYGSSMEVAVYDWGETRENTLGYDGIMHFSDDMASLPEIMLAASSHLPGNNWYIDTYGATPNVTHDFRVTADNPAYYINKYYHLVTCSLCGLQMVVPHQTEYRDGSGECVICDNSVSVQIYYYDDPEYYEGKNVWGLFSTNDIDYRPDGHEPPKQDNITLKNDYDRYYTYAYGDIGQCIETWGWELETYPSPVEHPDREPLGLPYTDEYTHDFRVTAPRQAVCVDETYHTVYCSCGESIQVEHRLNDDGVCPDCGYSAIGVVENEYEGYGGDFVGQHNWAVFYVGKKDSSSNYIVINGASTESYPNNRWTANCCDDLEIKASDHAGVSASAYPSGTVLNGAIPHDFRVVSNGQATKYDANYHTVKCRYCQQTVQLRHRIVDGKCIDCEWEIREPPHEEVTRSWTFTLDDAVQFTAQGDGTVTATINVSAKGIVLGEGDVLALYVKSGNATADEKFRILLTDGIAIGYTVSCNSDDHGKTADNTYDNDKGLLLWQLTWGSGQDPLNEDFTVTLTLKAPAQFAGEWKDSLTFTAVLVEA